MGWKLGTPWQHVPLAQLGPLRALIEGCPGTPGLPAQPCCSHFQWQRQRANAGSQCSSKSQSVPSGVESSNSKAIIIWCLPSGFMKTWREKWPLKSLWLHWQLPAVAPIPRLAGQAMLSMPRALAPSTPLRPAGLRRQQSSRWLCGPSPRRSLAEPSLPGSQDQGVSYGVQSGSLWAR